MAGHSKWANIQHRKGRQDEKRGKIWTRIIREITVAARAGGGDLSANPRLRLAVDKAKAANMPADRIKYNIDKASGALEGVNYEEIRYEGYGIGGAAIIARGFGKPCVAIGGAVRLRERVRGRRGARRQPARPGGRGAAAARQPASVS